MLQGAAETLSRESVRLDGISSCRTRAGFTGVLRRGDVFGLERETNEIEADDEENQSPRRSSPSPGPQ